MDIKDIIQEGRAIRNLSVKADIQSAYHAWCRNVRSFLKENSINEQLQNEAAVKMHYTDNEYSESDTLHSLKRALTDTLDFLEENVGYLDSVRNNSTELELITKILNNFYLYYQTMYKSPVHKKCSWTQEKLDSIQIGNEYDLQRMLYAIIRPLFPSIRQEVNSDNGYGGMRADLYLDSCNLIIETKCTRDSMSERQLTEELGADSFHYPADNICFFIWDRSKIIKNPEAFKKAFEENPSEKSKTIKVFITQPMEL